MLAGKILAMTSDARMARPAKTAPRRSRRCNLEKFRQGRAAMRQVAQQALALGHRIVRVTAGRGVYQVLVARQAQVPGRGFQFFPGAAMNLVAIAA